MGFKIEDKYVRNYTPGRSGYSIEGIVLHIMEGYLEGCFSWMDNPISQVSSQFGVGRDGRIWKFVGVGDTAWHAGGVANPTWKKLKAGVNPNLYTIGIENEGFTGQRWTQKQIDANVWLIATLIKDGWIDKNQFRVEYELIGHNYINTVSRGDCPGVGVHLTNDIYNPVIALLKEWGVLESPKPPVDDFYRVFDINNKQLGAYLNKDIAFNRWYSDKSSKVTYQNNDITSQFKSMANILEDTIKQKDTAINEQKEMLKIQEDTIKVQQDTIRVQKDTIDSMDITITQLTGDLEDCQKGEAEEPEKPEEEFNLFAYLFKLLKSILRK